MPIGGPIAAAGIGAAGSIISGGMMSGAASGGLAQMMAMFAEGKKGLDPFINAGHSATYSLAQLYGLAMPQLGKPGNNKKPFQPALAGGQPFSPEGLAAFERSPDYAFARDQGIKGIDFSSAAKGLLNSRGHMDAVTQFSTGLATQNFGNYSRSLLAMLSEGRGAASSLAGLAGQSMAPTGSMAFQSGAGEAAGVMGAANAFSKGVGGAANNWMEMSMMGRPSAYGPTPTGAMPSVYSGSVPIAWGGRPNGFNPWGADVNPYG